MINGPLFTIGSLSVWPYGVCMGLGIVCCFVFLYVVMTKRHFNDEAIDKILFIGIFATAFGVFMAAVVQGIYNAIAGNGFDLNSMTFYGGLIGGVASFVSVWNIWTYVIAPRTNKSTNKNVVSIFGNHANAALSDALPFIPVAITIAHAFGRLGCTMYGCCHGGETDAWYGIWMYSGNSYATKVVPTQLFECIFLFLLAGIMALLVFKFKFNYNFSLYPIAYGVWRFLIEYVRDDYRGSFIPGLTPSQFWSIIMVLAGIGYIFLQKYVLSKCMKHPELSVRTASSVTANATPADGISANPVICDDAACGGQTSVEDVAETPAEQSAAVNADNATEAQSEVTAPDNVAPLASPRGGSCHCGSNRSD